MCLLLLQILLVVAFAAIVAVFAEETAAPLEDKAKVEKRGIYGSGYSGYSGLGGVSAAYDPSYASAGYLGGAGVGGGYLGGVGAGGVGGYGGGYGGAAGYGGAGYGGSYSGLNGGLTNGGYSGQYYSGQYPKTTQVSYAIGHGGNLIQLLVL